MLVEVSCDKFEENGKVRPPIRFHKGLNAVVGNESGTTSVGKSTFLMILDFVFGGDDYIKKSREVHKEANAGPHVIKFQFDFDGKPYFFSRSTEIDEHNYVIPCDENYEPLPDEPMTLENYCGFLAEHYGLTEDGQTWRGCVSRFIRVDRRDTLLDTEKPLKSYKGEADRVGILALIKLFGEYAGISAPQKAKEEAEKDEKAYRDALSHEFIPAVKNITEYKANAERIDNLEIILQDLAEKSSKGLLELTSLQAEQITSIRNKIASLRRQRSMMESQRTALETSRKEKKAKNLQSDYTELLRFFPDVDLRKLEEVEEFHRQLSSILNNELRSSEKHLIDMISLTNDEIARLEQEQLKISQIPNVNKATLVRYAELQKEIQDLQSANDAFDKKGELKKRVELMEEGLNEIIVKEMRYIETQLNSKMAQMNEDLYEEKTRPPIFHTISADLYNFSTEDDHGTAMRHKGVILLDLAILQTTKLPFIVHDSVLLLDGENDVIEKILGLYSAQKDKQVFIAFDKTATPRAKEILKEAQVLNLRHGGFELFGRSWSKTKNSEPDAEIANANKS